MPNATITLTITAQDFEEIVSTSTKWGKDWMKQKGRFLMRLYLLGRWRTGLIATWKP